MSYKFAGIEITLTMDRAAEGQGHLQGSSSLPVTLQLSGEHSLTLLLPPSMLNSACGGTETQCVCVCVLITRVISRSVSLISKSSFFSQTWRTSIPPFSSYVRQSWVSLDSTGFPLCIKLAAVEHSILNRNTNEKEQWLLLKPILIPYFHHVWSVCWIIDFFTFYICFCRAGIRTQYLYALLPSYASAWWPPPPNCFLALISSGLIFLLTEVSFTVALSKNICG